MTHLFLSDVHIGRHSPERDRQIRHALIRLIQYAQQQKMQIHVLGDLFDYWMEYPGHTPDLGADVLRAFSEYHKATGLKPTYITGNHDNWTRGHFANQGFDVQPEYKILSLDSVRVFMHHGDGLANPQFQYPRPLFHRIIRHPLFVRLYQFLLPPWYGLELMKWFSARKGKRLQIVSQGLNAWSESLLQAQISTDGRTLEGHPMDRDSIDVVMNGHVHRAVRKKTDNGLMLQLPAFFHQYHLLQYTNGTFTFVTWNNEQQCLSTTEPAKSIPSARRADARKELAFTGKAVKY